MSGKIKGFTTTKTDRQGQSGEFVRVEFDKTVPAGPANTGVALEVDDSNVGLMRRAESWNSPQNEISNDVPPEVGGKSALLLKGSKGEANYNFAPAMQGLLDNSGIWNVRFWAKSPSASPELKINIGEAGTETPVAITPEWQKYEVQIEVTNPPKTPAGFVTFRFVAANADILLDNVQIEKGTSTNPTTQNDNFVKNLKSLRPGTLRNLQMGGQTMESYLQRDAIDRTAFLSMISAKPGPRVAPVFLPDFGLPELLELCLEVGANPWINLPGVLTPEEVTLFLEFMGAPADVGGGKLRAAQGREKPWTESFDTIFIEYGNEAWNGSLPYNSGGFNGADYWEGITQQIKTSPFTSSKYRIESGAHSVNWGSLTRLMRNHPSADGFAIAPYWLPAMKGFPEDFFPQLEDDKFMMRFRAANVHRTIMDPAGYVNIHARTTKAAGKETSVYEVNNTGLEGTKALTDDRREYMMQGWGPALVNANGLLLMQTLGIRAQNFFTLGATTHKAVAVIAMENMVTRPIGEAIQLANELILPNMLQTSMVGEVPKLDIETRFETGKRGGEIMHYTDTTLVNAYAYKDGGKRSLILTNLDPEQNVEVVLELPAPAKGSVRKLVLTGEIAASTPDLATTQGVTIEESTETGLETGSKVTLPPASMVGFAWEE